MARPSSVSIVIPVFNEEEAIGGDLDLVIQTMEATDYHYEIIVVDDGSTDRSADIVRQRTKVNLVEHPYNRGVGAARTTGIKHAQGDVVVITDGDGAYPNQDIPRLLACMNDYGTAAGAKTWSTHRARWVRAPARLFTPLFTSQLAGHGFPISIRGFEVLRKIAYSVEIRTIIPPRMASGFLESVMRS